VSLAGPPSFSNAAEASFYKVRWALKPVLKTIPEALSELEDACKAYMPPCPVGLVTREQRREAVKRLRGVKGAFLSEAEYRVLRNALVYGLVHYCLELPPKGFECYEVTHEHSAWKGGYSLEVSAPVLRIYVDEYESGKAFAGFSARPDPLAFGGRERGLLDTIETGATERVQGDLYLRVDNRYANWEEAIELAYTHVTDNIAPVVLLLAADYIRELLDSHGIAYEMRRDTGVLTVSIPTGSRKLVRELARHIEGIFRLPHPYDRHSMVYAMARKPYADYPVIILNTCMFAVNAIAPYIKQKIRGQLGDLLGEHRVRVGRHVIEYYGLPRDIPAELCYSEVAEKLNLKPPVKAFAKSDDRCYVVNALATQWIVLQKRMRVSHPEHGELEIHSNRIAAVSLMEAWRPITEQAWRNTVALERLIENLKRIDPPGRVG